MSAPSSNKTGNSDGTDEIDIDLLIVDDEIDFRESAGRYLKRLGFRVDEAEDGEEAVNITVNKKFDAVIMDIHMPGVSGIDALKQLMKQESPPKVIMLTGGGTIENAVESIKLGAYDFLTKPAKMDDLARLVKRACRTHVLEKENRQLKAIIESTAIIN